MTVSCHWQIGPDIASKAKVRGGANAQFDVDRRSKVLVLIASNVTEAGGSPFHFILVAVLIIIIHFGIALKTVGQGKFDSGCVRSFIYL